jgi:hypothetical protein
MAPDACFASAAELLKVNVTRDKCVNVRGAMDACIQVHGQCRAGRADIQGLRSRHVAPPDTLE